MRVHHNQAVVKLAPVLVRYLIAHNELSLPGLGTFRVENTQNAGTEANKRNAAPLNITFEQTKNKDLDEALVNFVANETGKMKVLAQSDIESELEGAITFLNTGKPYFISGLGTLTKKFDGGFEFHNEKFHHVEKEQKKAVPITEKNTVPQTYIDNSRRPKRTKPAIIILTLCILAIAATVWFYVKNAENANQNIEEVTVADTSTTPVTTTKDSSTLQTAVTASVPKSNFYKYILEITEQPRASKRYNQLKKINWPVEMETTDSVSYKLFILLPRIDADTARIKDSLTVLSGKKVWIE